MFACSVFYRSLLILYFICILLSYCCLLGVLNLIKSSVIVCMDVRLQISRRR